MSILSRCKAGNLEPPSYDPPNSQQNSEPDINKSVLSKTRVWSSDTKTIQTGSCRLETVYLISEYIPSRDSPRLNGMVELVGILSPELTMNEWRSRDVKGLVKSYIARWNGS